MSPSAGTSRPYWCRRNPAATRPKAAPGDRAADTHDRVRTDIIGTTGTVTLRHSGRLYHIGVSRTHAGTHIPLLVQDLHTRIVHAATGQLLRQVMPSNLEACWPRLPARPRQPRDLGRVPSRRTR
jgi:hypothetical protein